MKLLKRGHLWCSYLRMQSMQMGPLRDSPLGPGPPAKINYEVNPLHSGGWGWGVCFLVDSDLSVGFHLVVHLNDRCSFVLHLSQVFQKQLPVLVCSLSGLNKPLDLSLQTKITQKRFTILRVTLN